jgi:hypothetical protein
MFYLFNCFFEEGHSSHMDEYGGDDGGIGEAAAAGATTTEVAAR